MHSKREVVGRSDSFVLRLWWEGGNDPPTWRGWVQHAATGDAHYFDRVAELLAFVEARTGPLVQPPPGRGTGRAREGESE